MPRLLIVKLVIRREPPPRVALPTLMVARTHVPATSVPAQQGGGATVAATLALVVYWLVPPLVTAMELSSMIAVAAAPLPPPPFRPTAGGALKLPRLPTLTAATVPEVCTHGPCAMLLVT